LKDNGIAFFHTIGENVSTTTVNAWTNKYIFPNGMILSIAQLAKAMEALFVIEDWHNFGSGYDLTLMAWHENFERIKREIWETFSSNVVLLLVKFCRGAFTRKSTLPSCYDQIGK